MCIRDSGRIMPIAVISRPGYDASAMASPAMAWLRRFRQPLSSLVNPEGWRAPTLVLLRFDPDRHSATAIRRADPCWAQGQTRRVLRDGVTRRLIETGSR
ncbi:MAG: nicotinic acid mononucleotide adenylyltransferase, partial [Novosphingobium sp.]|nr:nicotinic acid mononucleotide adenylyltransferase [Novosphingobium sp.]